MALRQIVAYGLIALLVLAFVILARWRRYHSHARALARRRLREQGDEEPRTVAPDANE